MFKQIIKNKIKLLKSFKNKEAGFTLVEALTAIFILTFVVVGLMTVVSDSLFATKYAKDEITANYLLQEAIDYVRNDRDTRVFLNTTKGMDEAWSAFYQTYANANCHLEGCALDANVPGGNLTACPTAGCSYLYLDESLDPLDRYFYSTNNGGISTALKLKTNFRRKLIVKMGGQDQIEVSATVYWRNGNLPRERTLTTTLSKWQ